MTLPFLLAVALLADGETLIDFPTENRSLLEGKPESFFMYVNRDFEGQLTQPWEGGGFGFVRGPKREGGKIHFRTLHEGIDIRPVRRDASGEPLDPVIAAASGKVVHVNPLPGASNYGRYVVVEHIWNKSAYYTLYAHLGAIDVKTGQRLRQGERIARMGYTGAGIDRERAHLHFEVCVMLNDRYEDWHAAVFPDQPNKHGIYNGLNLLGFDPTRLLLEAAANPKIDITEYLRAGEPWFRIAVPASEGLFVLRAYPWLNENGSNPPGWAISFSRHGVPLAAEPLVQSPGEPTLLWVKNGDASHATMTRGLIEGEAETPRISDAGKRFLALLAGVAPGSPPEGAATKE